MKTKYASIFNTSFRYSSGHVVVCIEKIEIIKKTKEFERKLYLKDEAGQISERIEILEEFFNIVGNLSLRWTKLLEVVFKQAANSYAHRL